LSRIETLVRLPFKDFDTTSVSSTDALVQPPWIVACSPSSSIVS
jgi:hypothetical protein